MNFQRRNRESFFGSRIVLGVAAAIFLLVAYQALGAYINARKVAREKTELAQKIAEREREMRELESKLNGFESGEGLEIEAKSRLNLKKPDESVLIIVGEKNNRGDKAASSTTSLWQKVKSFFGLGR